MSAMELAETLCREVDDFCESGMESTDECIKLLDKLAKIPMTIQIIQKTNIGIKVNMMRKKMTDETIAKRAKNIIKEWKSVVDSEQKDDSSDAPPAKKQRKDTTEESQSEKKKPAELVHKKPEPSNRPSIVANFVSASFPPKYLENDDTRLKTAQMLLSALKNGEMPQGTHDPEDLAVKIELKLYEVHGSSKGYSGAVRSRVFNLRDKKNPALRENVLTGVVRAEKFAVMTAEEMASPEIRDMRDKFTKEAILEHQMSVQQGTPSDMFKCGKCGKKNCTYTQLQTRSSDEPMTTFVFCLECGNRWKFC